MLIDEKTNSLTREGYATLHKLLNTWVAEHPHGDPPGELTVDQLRACITEDLDTWQPELTLCDGCAPDSVQAAFKVEVKVTPLYAEDIEGFTESTTLCIGHLEDPGPIFGWSTSLVPNPEHLSRVKIVPNHE